MEEHDRKADELEQEADRMGEQTDRVSQDIDEVRTDFESKLGDPQAPGLLDEEDAAPGGTGESADAGDTEKDE
jgi:hypothetical protein